jgi:hypothetical protein
MTPRESLTISDSHEFSITYQGNPQNLGISYG